MPIHELVAAPLLHKQDLVVPPLGNYALVHNDSSKPLVAVPPAEVQGLVYDYQEELKDDILPSFTSQVPLRTSRPTHVHDLDTA